jgi:DNA-binding LacI/PurR family transcriptional regulator
MPSLAGLAELCGESRNDMSAVVRLLREDSLVHGKRRGAIIAGPEGSIRSNAPDDRLVWEKLKSRIGKEVLSGEFANSPLPPIGKLALRSGVSVNTLKKALDHLVAEGLLKREGRSYHPSLGKQRKHLPTIVFVSEGDRENGVSIADHRTDGLVKAFERDCVKIGYRSLCLGFNSHTAQGLLDIQEYLADAREPLGIIASLWGAWSPESWARWTDLFRYVARLEVPIIALDTVGNLSFAADVLKIKRFRALRIAGVRAGELVADFLIRSGHRSIAYVSPIFGADWARNRYDGVCRFCKRYGSIDVSLFSQDEIVDTNDLLLAYLGLDQNEVRALFQKRLTREELVDQLGRLAAMKREGLAKRFPASRADRTIKGFAHYLVGVARRNPESQSYDELLTFLQHLASQKATDLYLKSLCLRAAEQSKATAWVCSDDTTATVSLAVLREARVEVPRQVSIVGFDNWKGAHEHQLSSLDFNMDGMISQALVMIRDEKCLRASQPITEVDGYVVARRTTRA